jgi:chemotaxis protein MotB
MSKKSPRHKQDPEKEENFSGSAPRAGDQPSRRTGDIPPDEPSLLWLITFTDIMGLMLTFFVMMFAMSTPEEKPFAEMTSALQSEFNRFYGRILNAGPEDSIDISRIDYDRALDIKYLEALMRSLVDRNQSLKTSVTLMPQDTHLMMSLPEDMLFDVGKAEIRENSTKALFALGGTFSRMKNSIELVGHADPRPMEGDKNSPFASNWDLSLARAVAVAAALDKVGYTQPVAVRGASSGRYQDLEGIPDEKQRLDLSRRVDIDIMNHDGRQKKVVADIIVP